MDIISEDRQGTPWREEKMGVKGQRLIEISRLIYMMQSVSYLGFTESATSFIISLTIPTSTSGQLEAASFCLDFNLR